jgi:hypothetical protein
MLARAQKIRHEILTGEGLDIPDRGLEPHFGYSYDCLRSETRFECIRNLADPSTLTLDLT